MASVSPQEFPITSDVLKNCLAFRGQSAQLFNEVSEFVTKFQDQPLYPPTFPSSQEREGHSVTPIQHGNAPRITPAEAIAEEILVREAGALAQSFGRNYKTTILLRNVLTLQENDYPTDVLMGFSRFGMNVESAARARELILFQEHRYELAQPTQKRPTHRDRMNEIWIQTFKASLKSDGMKIGTHTAQQIQNTIMTERPDALLNRSESNSPKELLKRNIQKGVDLAQKLYLEAFHLAEQRGFPSQITTF